LSRNFVSFGEENSLFFEIEGSSMTAILVENLASKFSLSKEELVQEGIKAFLLK